MSVSRLPSGRWRAQVHDPDAGGNVSVGKVLGGPGSFATKREAKAAREEARAAIAARVGQRTTVRAWRDRWLSDPLFERPKESTMLHNAERTGAFAAKYGDVALDDVDDFIVAQWLRHGNASTVPALRAMFNDAMSAKAGRVVSSNPFAGLGLERTKGRKHQQPPTQGQMESMVRLAHDLTPPSFAAYLEFAALRWSAIRWDDHEVDLVVQWSAKVRKFTAPKCGPYTIALVGRASDVLKSMKRDSGATEFVFTTVRGTHYTPSSRTHHWNRVRAAAGLGHMSLYLATRHYFAWHALNVLDLPSEVVAEQLGHKDGGKLIEQLYGHPDRSRRRRKLREAYDSTGAVAPLRVVRKDVS
jgi:integrase